jgi:hypothetical protein
MAGRFRPLDFTYQETVFSSSIETNLSSEGVALLLKMK